MRRIGRVELPPQPLPHFTSHAAWCRWLQSRGCLSPGHRMCLKHDHCVASWGGKVEEPWRSPR